MTQEIPKYSEYLVMLDNSILIDCCSERKKELGKEWQVEVLISGENLPKQKRHCGIKPCLKGATR